MRRIGDILATQNLRIGQVMKIRSRWKDIAGEVLASHAEPLVIKNKILQVLCDSPAWAQQVGLLSRTLQEQIGKITRIKVDKVEGRFGMVLTDPVRKRNVHTVSRPDIDPRDIAKIKDPDLARAVSKYALGEDSRND